MDNNKVAEERTFSEIVKETQVMIKGIQDGLDKMSEDMSKSNDELRKLQKEFLDLCDEAIEILKDKKVAGKNE
jgi:methyl-accepting chemotaxis protein